MVVQTRVLHDGLNVTIVSGRLLSVPFDEFEGNRAPAVTSATGVGCAAATPYTAHEICITVYILIYFTWWSVSSNYIKNKKIKLIGNLHRDWAGLSRPIQKQSSTAPVTTPLGLMLTAENQKILSTRPLNTLYTRVLFDFFSHHYLGLLNEDRKPTIAQHPLQSCGVLHFDQKSRLGCAASLTPHVSSCGCVWWELCDGTGARLYEAFIVSLGFHLYLYAIWVNNHAVKFFI